MPIRHNGTESLQAVISFSEIAWSVAVCRVLTKWKRLAGHYGLLMVKVIIPGRTRYPWHPRKRNRAWDGFRLEDRIDRELDIELTGSLTGIDAASRLIVGASLNLFRRVPVSISCRLGRSMTTPEAQKLFADPQIQAHYFFGGRWESFRMKWSMPTSTCLYVGILEQFDLQSAVAHTVYRVLSRGLTDPLAESIMCYLYGSWPRQPLGAILRQTIYILVVHSRMFNDIPYGSLTRGAEAVIQRIPCVDQWAESAFQSGVWHTHPMVIQSRAGKVLPTRRR